MGPAKSPERAPGEVAKRAQSKRAQAKKSVPKKATAEKASPKKPSPGRAASSAASTGPKTVAVLDAKGKKKGEVELATSIFGLEPNVPVMHQVVRAQRASWRLGTHDTKTRSDVRGGGAKPWRQKGTGRARAGSIRSPLWTGGGVVFGPHPSDYAFPVPRKMRRLALLSALSAKAAEGKVIVLADPGFDAPSTKRAAAMLAAAGVDGKATVVVAREDAATVKSVRNLPSARAIEVDRINTYDVLDNEYLVFTESALASLQEVYAS